MNKRKDFKKCFYDKFHSLFDISEKEFMGYYDEAIYGGYPEEPSGSIWESEGKSIYVLIRILKPKKILEIGNFKGKSTNHILQAIEKNGFGEVTLLDIVEQIDYNTIHNNNFNRIIENSLQYLKREMNFDLILQDGNHTYEHVKQELSLILENNKCENYTMWGHDYYNIIPNACEVYRAYNEIKDKFKKFEPMKDSISNCGFIIVKR